MSSFHPNSPPGSVFRVQEDYQILLDGLDGRVVGYAPDTGHIAKGGIDVMRLLDPYRSTIVHVHFKDIATTGEWAAIGAGVIDFPRVVTMLRDTGYTGWIMIEEESEAAEREPDAATIQNGAHLRQSLWPLVRWNGITSSPSTQLQAGGGSPDGGLSGTMKQAEDTQDPTGF